MTTNIVDAIENIGKSFEAFKEINDKRIEEERKGNEARAKELAAALEKVSAELTDNTKKKAELEKRIAMQGDRLELLEALNDRPAASLQEKAKSEYKEAFVDLVRRGLDDPGCVQRVRDIESKYKEVKDVTIGTTTAGGFALPEEIARAVDKLLLRTSQITQFVKNVTVGTSDYKELISVNEATYAWSSETGTRNATNSPVLRERAVTTGELYAYPKASNWSLRDIFFNVEQWLTENIAEGFAVGLSTAIWSGDGSSKPTGFTNTAPATTDDYASPQRNHSAFEYIPITTPSSPFTSSGITADSVIDLVYQLNPRYRGNARFAANTVTQGHLRKLKDTTGQYLWQPSLQQGQPDRIMGYELFTWEDMGNPKTSGHFPLAFGDFSKAYTLTMHNELEVLRDPYTTKGYTAYYVSRRFGGIPTNNYAVKFLKCAVS
jgi:HK97 family phage major capsid protein